MSVKARTVNLTTTPVLLETPEKELIIYFSDIGSTTRIGGSDLTSTSNGFNPININHPGDSLVLGRGDAIYAVVTTGVSTLTYLAIGD